MIQHRTSAASLLAWPSGGMHGMRQDLGKPTGWSGCLEQREYIFPVDMPSLIPVDSGDLPGSKEEPLNHWSLQHRPCQLPGYSIYKRICFSRLADSCPRLCPCGRTRQSRTVRKWLSSELPHSLLVELPTSLSDPGGCLFPLGHNYIDISPSAVIASSDRSLIPSVPAAWNRPAV